VITKLFTCNSYVIDHPYNSYVMDHQCATNVMDYPYNSYVDSGI